MVGYGGYIIDSEELSCASRTCRGAVEDRTWTLFKRGCADLSSCFLDKARGWPIGHLVRDRTARECGGNIRLPLCRCGTKSESDPEQGRQATPCNHHSPVPDHLHLFGHCHLPRDALGNGGIAPAKFLHSILVGNDGFAGCFRLPPHWFLPRTQVRRNPRYRCDIAAAAPRRHPEPVHDRRDLHGDALQGRGVVHHLLVFLCGVRPHRGEQHCAAGWGAVQPTRQPPDHLHRHRQRSRPHGVRVHLRQDEGCGRSPALPRPRAWCDELGASAVGVCWGGHDDGGHDGGGAGLWGLLGAGPNARLRDLRLHPLRGQLSDGCSRSRGGRLCYERGAGQLHLRRVRGPRDSGVPGWRVLPQHASRGLRGGGGRVPSKRAALGSHTRLFQ
mmetsp:Transcript_3128/g.6519  ORF Transcript_3128/g.6519 Transcript_3128/m.6519 type:complete len:386 (-) Transcript_3128:453-1610(-)